MYNLLCDSIGITPQPNNGTLRLPLKPIGQHEVEVTVPDDPVTSYTVTSSDIERPTPPPAPTVAEVSQSAPAAEPTKQPEDEKTPEDKGNKGILDTTLNDVWDWITGTADDVWHKIVGEN